MTENFNGLRRSRTSTFSCAPAAAGLAARGRGFGAIRGHPRPGHQHAAACATGGYDPTPSELQCHLGSPTCPPSNQATAPPSAVAVAVLEELAATCAPRAGVFPFAKPWLKQLLVQRTSWIVLPFSDERRTSVMTSRFILAPATGVGGTRHCAGCRCRVVGVVK